MDVVPTQHQLFINCGVVDGGCGVCVQVEGSISDLRQSQPKSWSIGARLAGGVNELLNYIP